MTKVFVYVMTHLGDPDRDGCWGCQDCMGEKRDCDYEAVIGIGGATAEYDGLSFRGKVAWIGIGPHKKFVRSKKGPEVRFRHFRFYGTRGPKSTKLAARLRKAVHGVINLTPKEQAEAEAFLNRAKNAPSSRFFHDRNFLSKHASGGNPCPHSRGINSVPRNRCFGKRKANCSN